ncbi:hypothetical protein [Arenimonas terrae]|jgi:hypothetical protein|uniref:Class IIb bacteriocin, lactobin A/cerein 7B family n=1 Tax=Arenimonas terrae TaxID=2546226 RepID=A0A5C4RXV3_9GAMM|nr:hypothetical protein [Arenimonas terrae]TNJ35531.1 hypothetical protein E1B00_07225 [Arenimonas terrae]
MRELSHVELEMVEGGNPVVVAGLVIGGALLIGGLVVVAYGVSQGCSGSVEVSKEAIKVEVTCPPKTN